jgi:hypothetical protein
MKVLNPKSTLDYDFDHIHYCKKCTHWFVCKRSKIKCDLIFKSVTSHKDHIAIIHYMQSHTSDR